MAKGPAAPGGAGPVPGRLWAYPDPACRVGDPTCAIVPAADRGPHKVALYPGATDIIHYFLLVPMLREVCGAAHSVYCQACSVLLTPQRQLMMAEEQDLQMEGGTAIDAELRAMHFG